MKRLEDMKKSPTEIIYRIGKRKERCTKAINLIKLVMDDALPESVNELRLALSLIEKYRQKLNGV